jgi:MFS family permease
VSTITIDLTPPVVVSRATWSRRTSFWLVVTAQVLLLAGSNLATPLFPIYERQYGFGSAMVSLLFGVYVAALIPSMLTLGRITDRIGRRPALVAGTAATVASSIAFAGARNVGWLFAGEIIYGVAAGLVMSASTVTIRELHPRQHAASGALVAMVASVVGLTVGPLFSGVLATVTPWPTVAPFVFDIVAAGALALALVRIAETRPTTPPTATRAPALHVPHEIRRPWAAATLGSLTAWMVYGWILGLSPSFLHEQLGVHISQPVVAGLFAAAVLATNGATQIVMRRHHHRVGSLMIGMALIVVGLAGFAASAHVGGLLVAIAGGSIAGIGSGLVQPNTMATVQRIAPEHARGGVTSAYLAVSYLALSVPVVAAGLAAAAAGIDLATISIWYLAGTTVLVIAAFVAQLSTRRAPLVTSAAERS